MSQAQLKRLKGLWHHTEETKRLISQKRKGNKLTIEQRQRISEGTKVAMAMLPDEIKEKIRTAPLGHQTYWSTHPMPEEAIEKIRIAALADAENRRQRVLGNKNPIFGRTRQLNPNWRGGYEGNYPANFWIIKPYILVRDDYLCQLCFKTAQIVHHIDKDCWNSNEDNLISLCYSCHGYLQNKLYYKKTLEYLQIRATSSIARKKTKEVYA